jgi:uncharacterized membrane protein YgcG
VLRVLVLAALSWFALPALASERILSFDSHVTVQSDGGMVVTETIRVRAAGDQIKRGIYRDFPTRYVGLYGRVVVPFQVIGVRRDGRAEPYRVEPRSNGERVYIGRADRMLPPGEYEYELTYRTAWQIGFFARHDELYWNVTGNEWSFPIHVATVTVRLPRPLAAGDLRLEAFTGPAGATGRDYKSAVNERGEAWFRTTSALPQGHGLTIVVGWPKGLVAEPDRRQRLARWSRDNPEWKAGAFGIALLLVYYFIVWSRYGRDPKAGTIIPRFEPPRDISAADARFLTRMGYDSQVPAAALISLAVKGHLKIFEDKGGFSIAAEQAPAPQPLTNDERAFLAALRLPANGGRLKLESANHQQFGDARKALRRELDKEHIKQNFVTNSVYTIPGLIISAAVLGYIAFATPAADPAVTFMMVWLTGWTFGVYMLLGMVINAWREVLFARKYLMIVPALFVTAFSLPFIGGEIFGLYMLTQAGSPLLVMLLALLVGINYAFYRWLRAPTLAGRRLYDQLAGFRMYLSVAEKDRLNLLNAPQRTPELFEKYLPYALALGVENRWAEQFADVLASARSGDSAGYRPAWYGGSSWRASAPAAFTGSLTGAISAASTPPGSQSGGGGGGSSGGGGGGGGGGGW